ncbi:MAG: PIN domain-containing protein, partial [Verrucomicrobia bacterium]|nr:PIN domain-containing protein [Verrucomicrobiota bacterium]
VLDCSAALPWIFGDEASEATDRLLNELTLGGHAWVSSLWHLELANALVGAQRRDRIDQAGCEAFLSHLGEYDIRVDSETMSRAWSKTLDLALIYRLSVYDAAYLELALRRDLPLATLDGALLQAARISGVGLALQT